MINVTKKEQETAAAFIRRFTQRVQAGNVLKEAKKKKFFVKEPNRNMRRQIAIERSIKTAKYRKLWKLGKIKIKRR